jgi:endogenous inhibitor of DNA gyrase (YacG/DUF329 family)
VFEIDLDWPVASQYVTRAAKELRGHRAIFVAEWATLTMRRPFEDNPNLFAEFADLDGSEQSCLQFAHKYGTLIVHSGSGLPEPLRVWHGEIQHIRDIIQCCKLGRDRPAHAFRQFGKRDISLSGGLNAYLSIVSPKAPPTLTVRCESFSGALELQAIQSLLGGRDVVNCIECSKPFEIGAGARRSQSKFCSIRCKDTYHNRLKAEAKRGSHA